VINNHLTPYVKGFDPFVKSDIRTLAKVYRSDDFSRFCRATKRLKSLLRNIF
jgi:hypothetical protein